MASIIHVTGASGVGKSTLVSTALGDPEFSGLRYLTTFADRPPRDEELEGCYEYCFVHPERFDDIRELVGLEDWYEIKSYGSRKGVDVGYYRALLAEGTSLIFNSFPHPESINLVREKFPEAQHKVIYLHADPEVVAARISGGRPEGERARIAIDRESPELNEVRRMSDEVLECIEAESDSERFCDILRQLLKEQK